MRDLCDQIPGRISSNTTGPHCPAKFISFEGIDGCGKSTLMEHLFNWLTTAGIPCVTTREPGGTPIGEKIRELLLDPASAEMNSRTEVLLYSASKAQVDGAGHHFCNEERLLGPDRPVR